MGGEGASRGSNRRQVRRVFSKKNKKREGPPHPVATAIEEAACVTVTSSDILFLPPVSFYLSFCFPCSFSLPFSLPLYRASSSKSRSIRSSQVHCPTCSAEHSATKFAIDRPSSLGNHLGHSFEVREYTVVTTSKSSSTRQGDKKKLH